MMFVDVEVILQIYDVFSVKHQFTYKLKDDVTVVYVTAYTRL
jgi:hypothetical protein